jgi:hypothetical protein
MIGDNFDESRTARLSRWLVAAAMVVALHVGCVALAHFIHEAMWSELMDSDEGVGLA